MDILSTILITIIPAGIVFATAYFLIRNFLDNEQKKNQLSIKTSVSQTMLPIRLQAYERMALFLERISPNNLIMRVQKPGMSARLLHSELLKVIRMEYEHNLSQQIYMSTNAWEMVKNGKEEIIKLVNIASGRMTETSTGAELSQFIIEASAKIQKLPTQTALDYLKKEISHLF